MTWEAIFPATQPVEVAQPAELRMNDEAFSGFYERTARPLWAYIARTSGSATLADDLVQECYLRFLCANVKADGEVAQRRYLFRIATNLMVDHWRKPAQTPIEDVPESFFVAPGGIDVSRLDAAAQLGPALAKLRPRERQMLWLAYAEGANHREIAEITGLAHASVRLLLFRARRKLARLIGGREKQS